MSTYRKPRPYRKPQRYRGDPIGVAGFGNVATFVCPAGTGVPASAVASLPTDAMQARERGYAMPFNGLDVHSLHARVPFAQRAAQSLASAMAWDAFSQFARVADLPFLYPTPHGQSSALAYADFENQASRVTSLPFTVRQTESNQTTALPWGTATPRGRTVSAFWQRLVARGAVVALPWSPIASRQTDTIITWPVEVDPDGVPITVPILPVYFMIPSLSVVRLPERTPINALSVSLSCDIDSWAWTFNAPIAFSDVGLVNAVESSDPTEIEISVNGYVWNMLVEAVDDNRRFGSRTATMRGKSPSAELAQPYAPRRTYTQASDKTAAQLADDELDGTGWTLVWDAVDWLLPEGTFSYQDLTPMEVITRLADSIGAAVQTDLATKTINVIPNYEDSPWAWDAATPFAILPASIVTGAAGSWQGGTNADGIYVYAQNSTFGALVKITGSAGANQLPMIVDPLLVSADPVRERGRVELARAGKIKMDPITIPLFPSPATPGLIPAGKLLEIEETESVTWRARVTGVRIDAQRSGKATTVRQTLNLERQYRA